jgi:alkylation response protein AidB-like acyl-CoA dehydrogenase
MKPILFGDQIPYGDAGWYQGDYSPYFGKSHADLRAHLRDLVENDLMPYVDEWDENGELPKEFRLKAYSTGMGILACGHPFPIEYGPPLPDYLKSEPLDVFHAITVFQEISRSGSVGIQWGLGAGLCIGLPPVLTFGSEQMKARVAPGVLSGEKIICLAVTEPTAGSDVANLKTTATKSNCGNFYIVNGEKKWITNGIWADYFTVAVRTGDEGMGGISLLLLEKSMTGIKTRKMACSGAWCSGTTYISFENVYVPVENLIGKENKGFKYIVHNFNFERIIICAQAIGSARCCYEEAYKHAMRRRTFGKRLIEHQVIKWKLGDMIRQIEACQAWLENLAFQIETMHHREADYKLGGVTALLKVQCTKVFEYCAREAAQIFGGLSFSRGGLGGKVERLNREVRSLAIPGGSEEIMIDLGVRMTDKIAKMAQQFLINSKNDSSNKVFSRQLEMAKRAGINMDIFGDGNPFADPSWYLTFNSPYYNESHRKIRKMVSGGNIEGLEKICAGWWPYLKVDMMEDVQIDAFHELVIVDELARSGDSGLISRKWPAGIALVRALVGENSVEQLIENKTTVGIAFVEEGVSGHDMVNIKTKMSAEGVVSGTKNFVTNGDTAEVFIVAVEGGKIVLVDKRKNKPGTVSVERIDCSGMEGSGMSKVKFDGAIGTEIPEGLDAVEKWFVHERWVIAIHAIRFARICFEEAYKSSQVKEAGGKRLINHQGIRWKLGEMSRQIEAAFNWLENVTFQICCGNMKESSVGLVKMHATKLLEYCWREACQIVGAASYVKGCKLERIGRDIRGLALKYGSEEVLLDESMNIVCKRDKPALESTARL